MRIGNGIDVHAFDRGTARPLVLGGVHVAGSGGLAGHSDADVVVHALMDALLGAAGLGDLGSRFGIDEPEFAGASSVVLLEGVVRDLGAAGWTVGNVDLTVVAQRPRLSSHQEEIRASLGSALGIGADRVSVKVTSTDRLGAIGRGEGIACLASCLLVPVDGPDS